MSKDSYLEQGRAAIRKYRVQTGGRVNPETGRKEWTNYDEYMKDMEKIAKDTFSRPALYCGLCGYPMDYNGHKLSEWEQKWSVHEVCRRKMDNLLDRESGVARERKHRR